MRHLRFQLVLLLILSMFVAASSWGEEFCVDNNGSLQTALSTAASNGEDDTIKVVQGTYAGPFYCTSTEGRNIVLEGGYQPLCAQRQLDPSNTVLEGGGTSLVLSVQNVAGGDIIVEGFTIQNGYNDGDGGGVYARAYNSPGDSGAVTLAHNIIAHNSADRFGGAWADSYTSTGNSGPVTVTHNIVMDNSAVRNYGGIGARSESSIGNAASMSFTHNTFADNSAGGFSGGMAVECLGQTGSGAVTLTHNTITGNTAGENAGGVYIAAQSRSGIPGGVLLANNLVAGNSAGGHGGGLRAYLTNPSGSGQLTLTNNTFSENSATEQGGGVHLNQYDLNGTSTFDLHNNIIWGNTAPSGADIYLYGVATFNAHNNDYVDMVGTLDSASGNISDNPLFVGAGDYHLQPGSPCRDAGNAGAPELPTTDIDGEKRTQGAAPDMGADELPVRPFLLFPIKTKNGKVGVIYLE